MRGALSALCQGRHRPEARLAVTDNGVMFAMLGLQADRSPISVVWRAGG
jgi:hypothetical protein